MLLLFFPLTIERHISLGNLFDQLRQFQSAAAADRSGPLPSSDSPPWLRGDTRSGALDMMRILKMVPSGNLT